MIKTVYDYDKDTGEYLGTSVAMTDPSTGDLLLPPNSTVVAPLAEREGYAVVMRKGAWMYVRDLRGKTLYNKKTREAVYIKDLTQEINYDDYTEATPISDTCVWQDNDWFDPKAELRTEIATIEQNIANLKDLLLSAMLANNEDVIAELKQDYSEETEKLNELQNKLAE